MRKSSAAATIQRIDYAHFPLLVRADGIEQRWLELPVDADVQSGLAWVEGSAGPTKAWTAALSFGATSVATRGSCLWTKPSIVQNEYRKPTPIMRGSNSASFTILCAQLPTRKPALR